MAELADALASGASGGNPVEVQVLLPAFFMLVFKTGIFFCPAQDGLPEQETIQAKKEPDAFTRQALII